MALTHAKVAVIDHARLAVLTLNLTRVGLAGNREYAVIDDDPRDVAAADALLAADATGLPVATADPGRVLALARHDAAGPRGCPRARHERSGRRDRGVSDAALADARARGCAVSVALPGSGASAAATGPARHLAAAGVVVRLVDAQRVHAKAVVADGWLYVGSTNLTAASLDANREVGLGARDPAALALVAGTIADDLPRGRTP